MFYATSKLQMLIKYDKSARHDALLSVTLCGMKGKQLFLKPNVRYCFCHVLRMLKEWN